MKYNRGLLFRPIYMKSGSNRIEETAEQKELARIASERWGHYQSVFVPAENKLIDEMVNYDKDSRVNAVQGSAIADVQNASASAWGEERRALTSSGVDPTSGAFKSAISERAVNTARAESEVVNNATQGVQDQKVQGMKNVVAIGNGQAAEALQGFSAIANTSAQQAVDKAYRKQDRRASTHEAVGTVAGGAIRAAIEPKEKIN